MSIINTIPDEDLQEIINACNSISSILRHLNLSVSCGYYRKGLQKRMESLDCSQYNTNRATSNPFSNSYIKYEDDELFILNGKADVITVRHRLHKVRPQKECSICKSPTTWNGIPLTLHMDHINGNNKDNRLENLRWICPNCHSQTETYTGKNRFKPTNI